MSTPEPRRRPTRHLTIGVIDLRRRLGERMTVDIDVVLPPLAVVASHSLDHEAVTGSVVLDSIERGVSVLGSVTFDWEGDCRRCLEPVVGRSTVPIDELFQVDAPDDSDLIDFDGEQIDLLPLVRDAVLIGLPLAPLCRPDCAGPDPERYPTLTADEWERDAANRAEPEAVPVDPRWAALTELELPDEPRG